MCLVVFFWFIHIPNTIWTTCFYIAFRIGHSLSESGWRLFRSLRGTIAVAYTNMAGSRKPRRCFPKSQHITFVMALDSIADSEYIRVYRNPTPQRCSWGRKTYISHLYIACGWCIYAVLCIIYVQLSHSHIDCFAHAILCLVLVVFICIAYEFVHWRNNVCIWCWTNFVYIIWSSYTYTLLGFLFIHPIR